MDFLKSNNTEYNPNLIEKFAKKFNLHKDVIKLLFARNLTEEQQISNFLNPPETLFYDPFFLNNMEEVVSRINIAISQNKKILIMGDYDTDGISASAILYKYFKSVGVNADVFLPNRLVDGYGLTIETIDKVNKLYSPNLIITVDCGISCYNEVEYCKSLGIDIIVTDHHDIPEIIPNTLIINPKLPNQNYPFKELCGAGVAFKLVQALAGLEVAKSYLTIASLATVADIVPLVDENRAIVFYGLKNQDNMPIGLVKLCRKLRINLPISSQDIAYKLAPKINASGRMGDASISLKLYLEENTKEISKTISELIAINDRRVSETNTIFEDALKKLENTNISTQGAIVLYSENWESGVLGIICSKLVEKFNKPVCLLSLVDNEYKGSCRSIPGVNITEILGELKHLLIRFGGHNQAGGLSVEKKNIEEFSNAFNTLVLTKYSQFLTPTNKTYDLEITDKVDINYLKDLSKLEPFGLCNEAPIYKIELKNSIAQRMPNYPNHIKLKVFNIELLGFSLGEYFYNLNSNCKKQILIDLYTETYKNHLQIKGHIKHVNFGALNSVKNKDVPLANYLFQFNENSAKDKQIISLNKSEMFEFINGLTQNDFGTLIITNVIETYKNAISKINNILNFEQYEINDQKGLNTIVFAPKSTKNFKNYSNIVLLDKPINDAYILNLTTPNIYIIQNSINYQMFKKLSAEHGVFANYHNAIKYAISHNISALNIEEYFKKVKNENPEYELNYAQFVFVYLVLKQLNIIEKIGDFQLKYNSGISTQLTESVIYNKISSLIKGGK